MEYSETKGKKAVEEKPPFLSSWKQIYSIVFLNLLLIIVLFYLFTEYFR